MADMPCIRRFAGIETMAGPTPDETTILNFHHRLEEIRIAEQILLGVNQILSERRTIPKYTRWPRASNGSFECAAISELILHWPGLLY
jgi:IS5 family transposase